MELTQLHMIADKTIATEKEPNSMKVLGPRLINNDKFLLYIDATTMDPTESRKRKLSPTTDEESSMIIKTKMTNDGGAEAEDASTAAVTPTRDPSARKLGGKRKRKPKVTEQDLGNDYTPTAHDCICGRGKDAQNHVSDDMLQQQPFAS